MKAAKEARTSLEREGALADAALVGEEIVAGIDSRWEGLGGLIGEALAGVRGQQRRPPVLPSR